MDQPGPPNLQERMADTQLGGERRGTGLVVITDEGSQ